MHRLILLLIILFSAMSCTRAGFRNAKTGKAIMYYDIYEYETGYDNPVDSVKMYKGRPFSESLELYVHEDSISRFVEMGNFYFETFQVEKQKFAVIVDSEATTFYKYSRRRNFEPIDSTPIGMGRWAGIQKYDLNRDGYKDVVFTMVSGGTHGDDNAVLFYDTKTKNLIPAGGNAVLQNLGYVKDTLYTGDRFWSHKYVAKGYSLKLIEEWEYMQGENNDKVVLKKYTEDGRVISNDTLPAE